MDLTPETASAALKDAGVPHTSVDVLESYTPSEGTDHLHTTIGGQTVVIHGAAKDSMEAAHEALSAAFPDPEPEAEDVSDPTVTV